MSAPQELLAALVACPSVSGSETAVADLASAAARALGLGVTRIGDNVVAHAGDGIGEQQVRLLLASHLDTVPAGEGWTRDPWDARWADGRLYGRGSNDAKASGTAMLQALARCASEPDTVRGVAVALTVCEETTNTGMAAVLEALGMPAMAVVGEPTGLEVVRSQGGLAVLEAEWKGSSCHAAHAARRAHDNALIRAAGELARFGDHALLTPEHPLIGATTVVPTVFRSGERHNVVPDHAVATFDCRVAPNLTAADCVAHLDAALPTATIRVRSERLRPVETAADHPLVEAALVVLGKPAAIGSNTLSDMALLQGVPSIKCGPGRTERSHTPDEYVEESELLAGCEFYASLIRALFAPEVSTASAHTRGSIGEAL